MVTARVSLFHSFIKVEGLNPNLKSFRYEGGALREAEGEAHQGPV